MFEGREEVELLPLWYGLHINNSSEATNAIK
jgi:hypothetical protein